MAKKALKVAENGPKMLISASFAPHKTPTFTRGIQRFD
jgi:hypothetical protein